MTITEIGTELVGITENLARLITELTNLVESVTRLSAEVKALTLNGADESHKVEDVPKVKFPDISEVRGLLAEKSRAGHTSEIHALLEKHGCKKLSEVQPSEYAALMDEARLIE